MARRWGDEDVSTCLVGVKVERVCVEDGSPGSTLLLRDSLSCSRGLSFEQKEVS